MKIGAKQDCDWREDPKWKGLLTERKDPIGELKAAGVSYVEFNLWHPRQKQRWSAEEEVARVLKEAELLSQEGLPIAVVHPYAHMDFRGPSNFIGTPDDPVVVYLRMAIELAARLAELQQTTVGLVYHPAEHYLTEEDKAADPGKLRRMMFQRSCGFFQYAQEYIQKLAAPIRLLCETQLPTKPDVLRIGDLPEELMAVADQSGAAICWDTGHYRLSSEKLGFPLYPAEEFLRRVDHMHIHDVHNGKDHRPAKPDSEYLRECVLLLRSANFQSTITMEYDYGTEQSSADEILAVVQAGIATCRQS